jgi:hypothetical protein
MRVHQFVPQSVLWSSSILHQVGGFQIRPYMHVYSNMTTGRISTLPSRATGIFEAISMASSRSLQSMM